LRKMHLDWRLMRVRRWQSGARSSKKISYIFGSFKIVNLPKKKFMRAILFLEGLLTIPMAKRIEPSNLILLSKRFSRYSYVLVSLRSWKTGRNTMDMTKPTTMTAQVIKRKLVPCTYTSVGVPSNEIPVLFDQF